jgi:hypothetical protein
LDKYEWQRKRTPKRRTWWIWWWRTWSTRWQRVSSLLGLLFLLSLLIFDHLYLSVVEEVHQVVVDLLVEEVEDAVGKFSEHSM